MKVINYTKNIKKENLTSIYQRADFHGFDNVVFESACVENSPHPDNKIAFIIKKSSNKEKLVCLEFTRFEAVLIIRLLSAALLKETK